MLRVGEHFERTDTGRQRRANEDSYHARSPLFAVADGMGGAQAGEVASKIAVEVLQDGLPDGKASTEERLADLVREANAQIHELSQTDDARAGMGTTMTAAYVGEDELTVAHVGDSRIYLLRDGELERLSRDHSLVEELVREGKLTPEEADEHPQRSIITRALGPEAGVQVDTATHRVRDGDVILICSDGLTSMIPETKVREVLTGAASLREAGLGLVDAANAAGGRDNITVVLLRLEDVERDGGRSPTDEQATAVGIAAPKTAEVRAALAERERETRPHDRPDTATTSAARRRAPTPPRAPENSSPPTRRRRAPRARRLARSLAIVAFVLTPIVLAAYFATQTVYFVGTGSDGFVTLYRGVPYDLPAGVSLYTKNFESGVAAVALPSRVRRSVADHKLRSRDDAIDLVRQIERGELTGQ